MTRILALDTTAEFGSIALAGEEILIHSPEGFGGVIFRQIEQLLERTGLRLDDVDAFAAANGPGSFTGVRIGLACVKGLAEAAGKPAYAVSNLEAVARYGATELRAPVLDARRGECYAAVYDSHGAIVVPEMVAKFTDFLAHLSQAQIGFVSQNPGIFTPALAGTRFAACPVTCAPRAIAAQIAQIAAEKLARNEPADPAGLDANYVRRSDAELLFKPW